MEHGITYVGIDAHARELGVAVLPPGAVVPLVWMAPADAAGVERLRRKLEREAPGPIVCCYEAGPTGYALQRRLASARVTCQVIAPTLIPFKPGDRIKTDRRDARRLAELLRAGLLTEVTSPSPDEEAVRDLCRARLAIVRDRHRLRQRLGKLLLRRGYLYHGRNWTKRHAEWLATVEWPLRADAHVVSDLQLALQQHAVRLDEIERLIAELATAATYAKAVAAWRCFRGVDTVTAMTLIAELHDFRRFPSARALMAFVGLVPSEHSTGERRAPGPITKAGNGVVRRLLIEVAWHYRHAPGLGVALRRRRAGQPPPILAIAEKAEHRLCRRYRRLEERLKARPLITTAIARELVGFLWAARQLVDAAVV